MNYLEINKQKPVFYDNKKRKNIKKKIQINIKL